MIERFSLIVAQDFPLLWTSIEQQESARGGVSGEHCEHGPLVLRSEMEQAVPTENPIKTPEKRECLHLGHDPLMFGHTLATQVDERWRRIYPGHKQFMLDKMKCDGLS